MTASIPYCARALSRECPTCSAPTRRACVDLRVSPEGWMPSIDGICSVGPHSGRALSIADSELAVCFVGRGTNFHAVRVVNDEPEARPICGSGPRSVKVRAIRQDAWGEDAVDCPKCLRLMGLE